MGCDLLCFQTNIVVVRLSSMQEGGGYNPEHATGFIGINSIRLKASHFQAKLAEKKN